MSESVAVKWVRGWILVLLGLVASCVVLAQQQEVQLIPAPTPLGEKQQYVLANPEQWSGVSAGDRFILEIVPPTVSGELQKYTLVKVVDGSSIGSSRAVAPLRGVAPRTVRATFSAPSLRNGPRGHISRPAVLDAPGLRGPSVPARESRRNSGSSFFFGFSGMVEDWGNNTSPDYEYVVSGGLFQFGLRHDGPGLGVDVALGFGAAEYDVCRRTVVTNLYRTRFGGIRSQDTETLNCDQNTNTPQPIAFCADQSCFGTGISELDIAMAEFRIRFLSQAILQPFVMAGRQVYNRDFNAPDSELGRVSYAGVGLRWRISPGLSMSFASYDSDDKNFAEARRLQLDFDFQ